MSLSVLLLLCGLVSVIQANSLLFVPHETHLCPDKKGSCPEDSTCCQRLTGDYGCCPLPEVLLSLFYFILCWLFLFCKLIAWGYHFFIYIYFILNVLIISILWIDDCLMLPSYSNYIFKYLQKSSINSKCHQVSSKVFKNSSINSKCLQIFSKIFNKLKVSSKIFKNLK